MSADQKTYFPQPIDFQKRPALRLENDVPNGYYHRFLNPSVPITGAQSSERVPVHTLLRISDLLQKLHMPHFILRHRPIMTTDEKRAFLSEEADGISSQFDSKNPPKMFQTVTLTFPVNPEVRVLIGGIERKTGLEEKEQIGSQFELPRKRIKGSTINRKDGWNTAAELGLEPGVVGPFLELRAKNAIRAFYYLEDKGNPVTPVEFALSPEESLFVQNGNVVNFIGTYQKEIFGDDFFRIIPQLNRNE